jgi:hypothetical protein
MTGLVCETSGAVLRFLSELIARCEGGGTECGLEKMKKERRTRQEVGYIV